MELDIIATILAIVGSVVGGLIFLIKLLKGSIMEPINHSMSLLNKTIEGLREDLNDSNDKREDHEKEIYDNLDEHTKRIYSLDGRINTLETIHQMEKGE